MTYIRRLPSGQWQATVRLPNGKRTTRTSSLKRVVAEWARETESAAERGHWGDPRDRQQTFAQWAEGYMLVRNVESHTLRGDKAILNKHILPYFREYELGSIRPTTVRGWLTSLNKKTLGDATKRRAYNLMRTIMQAAVSDEVISSNPVSLVRPPAPPPPVIRWYTREQVDAIVAELPPAHAAMATLMAWCGLRWGETAGLRQQDIDPLRNRLWVVGAVTQDGRWKSYPKSSSSRREVPLPRPVVERLLPLLFGLAPTDLIFRSRNGTALSGSNWRKVWEKALARANDKAGPVPDYTPHALRHTAASWLVQAGAPLYEVQRLMGHSSPVMTQRYAHLAPGAHGAVEQAWKVIGEG